MDKIDEFESYLYKKGYNRISLLSQPSPLLHLKSLSEELDTPIYIKRDDLSEIGTGGNKLRKLEYLLAEAKKLGARRVITLGARQSNHARLTAVAARKLGLEVDLVLKNSVPIKTKNYYSNGNILLNNLVDANIHEIENDGTASDYIQKLIESYKAKGEKVYFIPVGGSNMVGGFGYAKATFEIENQSKALDINFKNIALASGSGGTHGGLLAGYEIMEKKVLVQAYNVQTEQEPLLTETKEIAENILDLFDISNRKNNIEYHLNNNYAGEAYGILNKETIAAIKYLAKTEGIFLDPVYTGKAFNGLINDIKLGRYAKKEPILFIHTGGIAGLFAYNNFLTD